MDHTTRDWETIIRIHNETKLLILLAEEINPDFVFFWPPMLQQRDALDHIVRAQKALLHPESLPANTDPKTYLSKQIDKALGHIFRAFFDTADWFSIILREKINSIVINYSRDVLCQVLPEYANDVEKLVESTSRSIAHIRSKKDIGIASPEFGKILEDEQARCDTIEQYRLLIRGLETCLRKLQEVKPKLDKLQYSK